MSLAAALEGFCSAFARSNRVLLVRMLAECVMHEAGFEEADAAQLFYSPQVAELGTCHGY